MNRALIAHTPLRSALWAVSVWSEAEPGQPSHAEVPGPIPLPDTTGTTLCS